MIVIDTHILIWWLNGDGQLSSTAKDAIDAELNSDNGKILVSSISAWELAMLAEKKRLQLTMSVDDWLATAERIPQLEFIAIDNHQAIESTRLPDEFHKDPTDRLIVALARMLNADLVTADVKIIDYPHVKTIA
ncbi:type II toxin-antitoxin system VapC family toxin [Marinomonas sp. TI.3.20]|uniref:type II toxin-antitoxin system VapC family toxin n=1 Tax=Marinomonas sp. TI.3.20 TaxID=3121296 RepID=UPI00311DAA06